MGKKTPPFPEHPEWTEAKFFSFLRSALRKAWQRWPPKWKKIEEGKRGSDSKRLKWEYQCQECLGWFPKKEIEVHHINPTGPLQSFEDLPQFASRLFVGVDKLERLCKQCHKEKE